MGPEKVEKERVEKEGVERKRKRIAGKVKYLMFSSRYNDLIIDLFLL